MTTTAHSAHRVPLACPSRLGIIDLKTCSKVTNRENMRGFKHVFDVWTAERRYHLVADNELDKRDWIDTLNTTLFTPSSSTTAPDTSQQQQQVRCLTKHAKCLFLWNLSVLSLISNICCFRHSLLHVFVVSKPQKSRPVALTALPRYIIIPHKYCSVH